MIVIFLAVLIGHAHLTTSTPAHEQLILLYTWLSWHAKHSEHRPSTGSHLSLFILCALVLRQVVLFQQVRDLISTPQAMVDLVVFGSANCGKLNYRYVSVLSKVLNIVHGLGRRTLFAAQLCGVHRLT